MIYSKRVNVKWWDEVVNAACYTINPIYLRLVLDKTSHVLWIRWRPNIRYFHEFGRLVKLANDTNDENSNDDAFGGRLKQEEIGKWIL